MQTKRKYDYLSSNDPEITKYDLNYQTIANGTSEFVDTLFSDSNMEKILRQMIRESCKTKSIGWLPCYSLKESDLLSNRNNSSTSKDKVKFIVNKYREASEKSGNVGKEIYITNFAMSTVSGKNHYCAFWINKVHKILYFWDSATSKYENSEFTKLFRESAKLLFSTSNDPSSLGWVKEIKQLQGTTNETFFQYGGGYLGKRKSLLHQNIFCHTWTLFFLELLLFGMSPKKIGCIRGKNSVIPLMIIKLYAQCLLKRIQTEETKKKKYIGLWYIWDEEHERVIRLPNFSSGTFSAKNPKYCCAKNVVDVIVASKNYEFPKNCEKKDFEVLQKICGKSCASSQNVQNSSFLSQLYV